MADSIQVGDIGTRITLDCVEDISTAVPGSTKILYTKPDGATSSEWDATVSGTTLYYDTVDGDIDQAGDWCLQTYVELSGGWEGRGERYCMTVKKNCG